MFLVRIQLLDALLDATSRLAQLAEEADIKFTPTSLWIIASHSSPRFVTVLQMSNYCFNDYTVDDNHISRISLEAFHDALLDGGDSYSLTIHLLENMNQMVLRFETSARALHVRHELSLAPSKEEDLGEVDYEKFFTIDSRDLRRIIIDLPIFHDDSAVWVTVTDSHVKFSVAYQEIILSKEEEQCTIVGYEEEDQTQFRMNLHPMLFFLNFTRDVIRIWFYKTITNSHGVMTVPAFGFHAQYLIFFPQT